ncbi:dienelactone hydrolase family protein [Hyalangium rubrum]|uniref:Dienelactone hydrolase family protein n=1 Tax=Hyalangium rubrum TaxID=3103134 RepID=A0ABU5GWU8_9BACT|nr:dienelactone hydrolase family protein [Hyalangium sp. s54d21]MDY7225352.1 dienelactone hydrolase family protein [Hyalangium sp. s54d21]
MSPPLSPQIHTEYLDYVEGETVCQAYVAYAESSEARRPGILVAHAWDGQSEPIRERVEQLAGLGYVGFALDVYGKGVRGGVMEDNSHLMGPFMADRALLRRRLLAGLAAARRHERIDPDRIAAIGYCFGGLCALDLARSAAPGLRGVVSFHGLFHPPALGPQAPIQAKVLILHGWDDPMAPPADVLAVTKELTEAKADWQLHAYGHAMHAFTYPGANNPQAGIQYNAAAERRSWIAMRAFLEETLNEGA